MQEDPLAAIEKVSVTSDSLCCWHGFNIPCKFLLLFRTIL